MFQYFLCRSKKPAKSSAIAKRIASKQWRLHPYRIQKTVTSGTNLMDKSVLSYQGFYASATLARSTAGSTFNTFGEICKRVGYKWNSDRGQGEYNSNIDYKKKKKKKKNNATGLYVLCSADGNQTAFFMSQWPLQVKCNLGARDLLGP